MFLKDQWPACEELIEKQLGCPCFQMVVPNGYTIQMNCWLYKCEIQKSSVDYRSVWATLTSRNIEMVDIN